MKNKKTRVRFDPRGPHYPFSSFSSLIMFMFAMILVPTVLVVQPACHTSAMTSVKNAGKTGGTAFIDCAKADLGKLLPDTANSVLAQVTAILYGDSPDWQSALDQVGTEVGADTLACAVSAVATVLGQAKTTSSTVVASAAGTPLSKAQLYIKNKGWTFKSKGSDSPPK